MCALAAKLRLDRHAEEDIKMQNHSLLMLKFGCDPYFIILILRAIRQNLFSMKVRLNPVLFVIALSATILICPAQASKSLVKPPKGFITQSQSDGRGGRVWSISSPDYSATAVVVRMKAPVKFRNEFPKWVRTYQKTLNDTYSSVYGFKIKITPRKDLFIFSASSAVYRAYGQGKIGKDNFFSYGFMVGKKNSPNSSALEKMIKDLK
jgi:hypothetical protein